MVDGHIYIILDVVEEDGRRIVKIGDPWANAPDLMEDQEVRGVYNIEFNTFLETFTKLLLVKVIYILYREKTINILLGFS